jgi:hypothetical protein
MTFRDIVEVLKNAVWSINFWDILILARVVQMTTLALFLV